MHTQTTERQLLNETRGAYRLTLLLTLIIGIQALTGLLGNDLYRDVEWAKVGWIGNDALTLLLATPLLLISSSLAIRGSVRAFLVWIGVLGYVLYNYVFYLFGASLNTFFPLYLIAPLLAVGILILLAQHLNTVAIAHTFKSATPEKVVGGYFVFFGTMLSFAWLSMWAGYIFAQKATPIEPDAFKIIAAADITLIVPLALIGGVMLWRGHIWGYILTAMVAVQGSLYLLVLVVNFFISMQRGLSEFPGELPLWGTLWLVTVAVMVYLYTHIENKPQSA